MQLFYRDTLALLSLNVVLELGGGSRNATYPWLLSLATDSGLGTIIRLMELALVVLITHFNKRNLRHTVICVRDAEVLRGLRVNKVCKCLVADPRLPVCIDCGRDSRPNDRHGC